jgi:hypothetical protein
LHARSSELFRANHGHEQIDEQQERDDADNHAFHRVLLELFAEPDVEGADEKECDYNSNEN